MVTYGRFRHTNPNDPVIHVLGENGNARCGDWGHGVRPEPCGPADGRVCEWCLAQQRMRPVSIEYRTQRASRSTSDEIVATSTERRFSRVPPERAGRLNA